MTHETDYQRNRRQRIEVKKYGITGATPKEAVKRIKEHAKSKALSKAKDNGGQYGKKAMERFSKKRKWLFSKEAENHPYAN